MKDGNVASDSSYVIRNRADLIQALTVASQLEQGLMLMYLYAAFSMKAFTPELEGESESAQVLRDRLRNWESMILLIARQEMEHLGFVCNMLSAIGGNQYFDRPNFPQSPLYWSDVNLPIELEKFSVGSLRRFLAFEKPANLNDPELWGPKASLKMTATQPVEPRFSSIGELYGKIRQAFQDLPEDQLFLVPADAQVDNETLWGAGANAAPVYNMLMLKVYNRETAMRAIDEIIEQGEGTLIPSTVPITIKEMDPECHYMLFRRVLLDYMGTFTSVEPKFKGARNCVRNPAWELHQDTSGREKFYGTPGTVQSPESVAIITHPWTRQMMGVSNTAYESLMQMLIRLYTFSNDTPDEVNGLISTVFFPMMTTVIRPISELMSLLPAFENFESDANGMYTAGAGFEFFRTIGFLPHKPSAWITIYERLSENAQAFNELVTNMPPEIKKTLEKSGYNPDVALPFINQNLTRIASNFKTYMKF